MGRHTGPGPDKVTELEVKATTSPANGAAQNVSHLRGVSVQFDGNGSSVTGAVQLQGSIGGIEFIDIGSPISSWPSRVDLDGKYFTHLRCKTTTNITVGTPRVRIGGFYD